MAQPASSPGPADAEVEHPAEVASAEGERRAGDLAVRLREQPESRVVVAAPRPAAKPVLERLGRVFPVILERFLDRRVESAIVSARTVET